MRKEILTKIHANHFGAKKWSANQLRMAREVLFLPGMRKSSKTICDVCGTVHKRTLHSLWSMVSSTLLSPLTNGRAEAAVKVAESMLKKADDFHSALLLKRNTHLLRACSYDALEPYCPPLIISCHLL